jgi:hypothetical protein
MPEKLILQPTATSHWKQLLQEAEQKCNCRLDDEVESYLIFTLIRFTQNPQLASQPLAPDYLKSQHRGGHAQQLQLRDVGDQCLLLSGLFPQRAEKRLVRVSYYVDLGRSAYDHLSQLLRQAMAELYQQLAHHFVQLMDVLQNLRAEPALQPLQALELWSDTGSTNAYGIVTTSSGGIPVRNPGKQPH